MTGSTGTLFLYGIVLGAIGVLGLGLLLAGARRTARRGRVARRGLEPRSRRETASASQERDALIDQRDTVRAYGHEPDRRRHESDRRRHEPDPASATPEIGHAPPPSGRTPPIST